jgi:hypothetical protein
LENGHRDSQPRNVNASENITLLDYESKLRRRVLFFDLDLVNQGPFRRRLIEPGLQQSEADVAEREAADDKKEASAPTKKSWES